jgi:hypothetical protein
VETSFEHLQFWDKDFRRTRSTTYRTNTITLLFGLPLPDAPRPSFSHSGRIHRDDIDKIIGPGRLQRTQCCAWCGWNHLLDRHQASTSEAIHLYSCWPLPPRSHSATNLKGRVSALSGETRMGFSE